MTDIEKLAALFDKLSTDDAFRRRLESDPAGALLELGVHIPQNLPVHVRLPSKEDVQSFAQDWLKVASDASTAMAMFFFLR